MIQHDYKVGVIGSGNVASHFVSALKKNGYEVVVCEHPSKAADTEYARVAACEVVVIAVKDDVINEVAGRISETEALVVHTSGSVSVDALKPIRRRGSLYPLQTLSKQAEIDFRSRVPLLFDAVDVSDELKLKLLAESLSDTVIRCSDADRRKIHLAAVFVSNFVNIMIHCGGKVVGDEFDMTMFQPLVNETVRKVFEMGSENALTGPARRKDLNTIDIQLKSLSSHPEEKKIYEAVTKYILNNVAPS